MISRTLSLGENSTTETNYLPFSSSEIFLGLLEKCPPLYSSSHNTKGGVKQERTMGNKIRFTSLWCFVIRPKMRLEELRAVNVEITTR